MHILYRKIQILIRLLVGMSLVGVTTPVLFAYSFAPYSYKDLRQEFQVLSARLRHNPNDVTVLNSLGVLYARAGQLNDAILLWNRAMSIDPSYVHLYNNLGSALKAQGRLDEAAEIYRKGLSISPSFWIYYNLGLLEKDRGRYAQAGQCFQECLRLNPRFEAAVQQLESLGYVLASRQTIDQTIPFKPPVSIENLSLTPIEELEKTEDSLSISNYAGAPSDTRRPWRPRISTDLPPSMTIDACAAYIERVSQGAPNRVVALTFDDGPHATITPQLLDLLKAYGAKGTFFVVGSRAETYPHLLERMVKEGHEVGNHSWNHHSLVRMGIDKARADLQHTAATIEACTNVPCKLVRPPYGHTNSHLREMIHAMGWAHIMWDADSRDWQLNNPDQILTRVLRKTSPGAVLLFHDIHPGVLRVLPVLIPALKKCGYRFVTISELLLLQSSSS